MIVKRKNVLQGLLFAAPAVLLGAATILNLGYLKDDAFISFRYARNVVEGHGWVFNIGEHVEGYTNFLWVLLHAPVIALGLDPVTWSKIFGAASAFGTLILVFLATRWLNDGIDSRLNHVAPLIFASSSSVAVWSTSGMAPCLVMFFGTAAVFGLWKSMRDDRRSGWIWTGLAMTGAALTRPEGHLFFIVGMTAVIVWAMRAGRLPRHAWMTATVFGAVMIPYHLWRWWYYGRLLPLTYYAKGSGGPEVWGTGFEQVVGLLGFNLNFIVAGLGLVSLIPRRDRGYRAIPVVLWLVFMLYMVKIGADEMRHFRLFLPVYGLFVISASEGFRLLWGQWEARRPAMLARGAVLVALLAVVGSSFYLTVSSRLFHLDYRAMMEESTIAMGRHILERSAPDDVVIFQDLGACPYAAYPLRFVDPIGVLNPFVAEELARLRLNPFLRRVTLSRPGGGERLESFDRTVREHLFEVNARWVGLVAYRAEASGTASTDFGRRLSDALDQGNRDRVERLLAARLRSNPHAHGMYDDPRFARRYAIVGVWRRSRDHYLALFERRPPTVPPGTR